ncbi:MAG: DUF3500 domain-containing protein, partial [Planctomycetales bacterium]|nr:DUF3500 domain-containing protein [Planctomycetales bacterium]
MSCVRFQYGLLSALICVLLATSPAPSFAHSPGDAMADAANHFLAALDNQQREKAQFKFDDKERLNWQFVPMDRAGLPLREMKPNQQHLAMALLNSALSHRGFSKALNIMALEQILHEMENNS